MSVLQRIRDGLLGFRGLFYNLAALLIILSFFRCTLVICYHGRLDSFSQLIGVLTTGFRFDLIVAAWALAIPVLIRIVWPIYFRSGFMRFLQIHFIIVYSIVVFLELSSFSFFDEYDLRPNRLMLEYLNDPGEVFGTILASKKIELTTAFCFILLAIFLSVKLQKRVFSTLKFDVPLIDRFLVGLSLLGVLLIGARGTKSQPLDASDAAFSNNHFANELALNSEFTLGTALYVSSFERRLKVNLDSSLDEAEVFKICLQNSTFDDALIKNRNPLMHLVKARRKSRRPLNFVIILEESLGAEFVGSQGGLDLTPSLDRLANEGLYFKKLYAAGTRSARGIEAIISGFLPTQSMSTIKLGLSQNNFFTIATALKNKGYRTSFIYGGDSGFDNMRTFSIKNGFSEVIDERNYQHCNFKGIWGCSDEDLFNKANEWFLSQGDKPFFSLVFTSSNHGPFEYPEGRILVYEEPKHSVHNTVRYADFALGEFFKVAKKQPYYKDTIFLVVADHNWKSGGSGLVPIEKMRIPGLLIGPNIEPATYAKPMSQVDLVPTALPYLGIDVAIPMIGHDINLLPQDFPGRAILQFDRYNAYLKGDDVLIHGPDISPSQFRYENLQLVNQTSVNREFAKEAAAHVLLPFLLYSKRLYSP